MRSFDEMLSALCAAQAEARFTATRVGEPGCAIRRDAAIRAASLDDVIEFVRAISNGKTYRSPENPEALWIITQEGGGWKGDKPSLDLDDAHPLWLNPREVRDWIDDYEMNAAEAA